jgi:uncharacterized glyoxalase superfamily protein PhnB
MSGGIFARPQVNLFVDDVATSAAFFLDHCGFTETFRTPEQGAPVHVEMVLDDFTLGVADHASAEGLHALGGATPGLPQCDVTLWCVDADTAYEALLAAGATPVSPPHDFLGNRAAWVKEPGGHLVSLVAKAR